MSEAAHESPAALLQRIGLRLTRPRLRIVECLQAQAARGEHATIEQLFVELAASEPAIGMATLYRVLAQLEAAGAVQRHHFDRLTTAFELVAQADASLHHHFVDANAGVVLDFSDGIIEQRLRELAKAHGFQYLGSELTLYVQRPPMS